MGDPISPTSLLHWVGPYDLAGADALTAQTETFGGARADRTTLRDQLKHTRPLNVGTYQLSESGFLTTGDDSLRRILADGGPWPSARAETEGAGHDVTVCTALAVSVRSAEVPKDQFGKVAVEFAAAPGAIVRDGRLLAGGQRQAASPNAAAIRAAAVDLGAALAAGAPLYIAADGIEWDGATQLVVQIKHADDQAGLGPGATGAAELTIQRGNAPYARNGYLLAEPAALKRWLGITWNWTAGNAPSAKIMAALAA